MTTLTSTMMTVTRRHATTIFDRANLTILDVANLSDPTPVSYEPEDFFAFYQYIVKLDQTLPPEQLTTSTPYSFLLTMTKYLRGSKSNRIEPLGGSKQIRLQEFLATPIIIYNDAWLGQTTDDPDMGKSLSLATTSYRVY
jgi:hypothetical protein